MDMLQEFQYRVEHQHNDGSWSELEEGPSHGHDPAAGDPERGWAQRTFSCVACGEVMRLLSRKEPPAPDAE